MLSHRGFSANIIDVDNDILHLKAEDVHLSYLPLPHMFERL
jgi:long-subunit acyl-CoA synthetase (AMP-forming)